MAIPPLRVLGPEVFFYPELLSDRYQWHISKVPVDSALCLSYRVTSELDVALPSTAAKDLITNLKSHLRGLKDHSPDLILDFKPLRSKHLQVFMRKLEHNTQITSLSLRECGITDVSSISEMLTKNSSIKKLILSSNKLSKFQTFTSALAINSSLTTLSLISTGLQLDSMITLARSLSNNTSLTSLDVSGNDLSEAPQNFMRSLKGNATLRFLAMNETGFGDSGAKAIARILNQLPALTTLNLDSTGIGKSGGRALLIGVGSHPLLTYLSLDDNPLLPPNLLDSIQDKLAKRIATLAQCPSSSSSSFEPSK